MVRRFFKDIFPWVLLVSFFILGVALAFAIGRELRRGGGAIPAIGSSEAGTSSD
jgi:hypothetical protein